MHKIEKHELKSYCGFPVLVFERVSNNKIAKFIKWWDILDQIDESGVIWTAYSENISLSDYGVEYIMYTIEDIKNKTTEPNL